MKLPTKKIGDLHKEIKQYQKKFPRLKINEIAEFDTDIKKILTNEFSMTNDEINDLYTRGLVGFEDKLAQLQADEKTKKDVLDFLKKVKGLQIKMVQKLAGKKEEKDSEIETSPSSTAPTSSASAIRSLMPSSKGPQAEKEAPTQLLTSAGSSAASASSDLSNASHPMPGSTPPRNHINSSSNSIVGKKAKKQKQENKQSVIIAPINVIKTETQASINEKSMSLTRCKEIRNAIEKSDLMALSTISDKELKEFKFSPSGTHMKNGFNALFYACLKSNPATIEIIINRMDLYFKSYLEEESVKKGSEKAEQMEEDFEEFFYEEFCTKNNTHNAATVAKMRGDEKTVNLLYKIARLRPIELLAESKNEMKEHLESIAEKYGTGYSGQGFFSKDQNTEKRQPRKLSTFAGERERQLLKQLSTMLFFHMPSTKERKLVEIEIMHVRYDGKSYLFVAGNEAPATIEFQDTFPSAKSLKKKLKTMPMNATNEGKKRMSRYVNNFAKLITNKESPFVYSSNNGEVENDIMHYQEIRMLFRQNDFGIVNFSPKYTKNVQRRLALEAASKNNIRNILNGIGNKIIFINTSETPKQFRFRHAEEFLTDIAEIVKMHAKEKEAESYICVSGKKRPCVTCYARMKSSKVVDTYGNRPGLIWHGAFWSQDSIAAMESLETLVAIPAHITVDGKGKENPAYDTGTDTESDNEYPPLSL